MQLERRAILAPVRQQVYQRKMKVEDRCIAEEVGALE
jgi:hypothetical protein